MQSLLNLATPSVEEILYMHGLIITAFPADDIVEILAGTLVLDDNENYFPNNSSNMSLIPQLRCTRVAAGKAHVNSPCVG